MRRIAGLCLVLLSGCSLEANGTNPREQLGVDSTIDAELDGRLDDEGVEVDDSSAVDTAVDSRMVDDTATTLDTAPEAGTDTLDAFDATPPDTCVTTTITAAAATTDVWLGQTATTTATASSVPATGLSYAWTFTSRPVGSAAAFAAPTSAAATFVPDVPGDYVAQVTVSACGATKAATATVKAFDAPVFYESLATFDATTSIGALTMKMAGAKVTAPIDLSTSAQVFLSAASTSDRERYPEHARFGIDVHEGAPGTASRAAIVWFKDPPGGPNTSPRVIYAATSDSRPTPTSSAPRILVDSIADNTASASEGKTARFAHPRFSPDGTRVAFVIAPHQDNPNVKIATVPFTGGAVTQVASYFGTAVPSGALDQGHIARPQWVGTALAWARILDNSTWELVTAIDAAAQTPARFFSCPGALPKQFAVLANSEVVTLESAVNPGDIKIYKANLGVCTLVRNVSQLTAGYRAFDFALTPDQKSVAYVVHKVAGATVADDDRVLIAPLDGSTPPAPLGAVKTTNGVGPRFVAGGSALALTVEGKPTTVPRSGGPVRTLDVPTAGRSLSTAGSGGACTIGFASTFDSNVSTFTAALFAAAVALAIRRRR